MALILIIEDEKLLRWALTEQLSRAGHAVHAAGDLAEATEHLRKHQPDVLLLDLSLPDGHGLDFYEQHESQLDDSVVIVMTAVGQIEDAVRAMKLGALDFLNKPVDQAELVRMVERSLTVRSDQLEAQASRQSRERTLHQDLVAESPAFRKVLQVAEDVAQSEVGSILLLGESGSGKNVLAREIHAHSARKDKPLIEVPCAAIPDQLLESELLGHERGAFTDAKTTRKGAFELADGGTVVLDEIGELKLELQAKLLHVLEERRLRRVGGSREIFVDVRVIALTNRDLRAMVRDGSFRRDLFYRLNIFPIQVPPLREHPEDILPLARFFLDQLQAKFGRRFEGFSRAAENCLLGYSWPGNARELRNVIERAMVLERSPLIEPGSLVLDQLAAPADVDEEPEDGAGIMPLEEMERRLVERAMQAAGGNQTRAAELLGVSRDQLRYRLKKFEL
jgi:DNA-binding NtrC family response regulator